MNTALLISVLSIVGSVVLSVIGNLITPWVQRQLNGVAAKRSGRAKRRRITQLKSVLFIWNKPQEILRSKIDAVFELVVSAFVLVLALVVISIPSGFPKLIDSELILGFSLASLAIASAGLGLFRSALLNYTVTVLAHSRALQADIWQREAGCAISDDELWRRFSEWDKKSFGVCVADITDLDGHLSHNALQPAPTSDTSPAVQLTRPIIDTQNGNK